MCAKRWSDEEVDFLRQVYPAGGVKAFHLYFPKRSQSSIEHKVSEFNLSVKFHFWSGTEILILKKYYPSFGLSKCCELLPQRSKFSLRMKISKLGLKRLSRYWSKEEDEVVKNFYPSIGAKALVKLLPERSFRAIQKRAFILHINVLDFGGLISGSRNSNWHGGLSYEPYGVFFNSFLKGLIIDFYGYRCLNCNGIGEDGKLDNHHLDYNKRNNSFMNLVLLCPTCHGKSNFNRDFWKVHLKFLQEKFWKREGLPKSAKTPLTQGVIEVPTEGSFPMNTVCANEPMFPPAKEFPVGKRVTADVCFPSHVDGFKEQGVD